MLSEELNLKEYSNGKDTKYRKYLEGLERIEAKTKLDKATKKVKDMLSAKAAEKSSFVKRRMELAGKNAY